ncbi:Asparagine-rich protein (ARP protein) [Entomophthora muscae]|uniref:Asparagine-rich protein (ARP protein) n=1 Tax=Entomophthora muscae TaxID=34485 RepID=A0ACC2UDX7_9FUNG|nr:Asparagine-rich protein (ARP protein) [Entomophthora muscae]
MSVDYDQFIEEESRAVLLTGLSPKVTQPELMAWFGERGLKPIRLLTIQNPTSGASSGICQAIFASHSEARRTFSLNMDFMGIRLVEVSPSSQSFSATMHLTPLPAVAPIEKVIQPVVAATTSDYSYSLNHENGNKNSVGYYNERSPVQIRPISPHRTYKVSYQPAPYLQPRSYDLGNDKSSYSPHDQYANPNSYHSGPHPQKVVPGDWTCPVRECESYNYAFRLSCFKCHCPKPQPPSKYSSSHSSSGYRHRPAYHSPNHNGYHHSPYPQPSRPPRAVGRAGDWFCPNTMCGFENFASRVACLRCGVENPVYKVAPHSVPAPVTSGFRPGDWHCPGCNSHNFASRFNCMRCSAPRSESKPPMMPPSNENPPQPLLPGDWHCRNNNCGFHNFAKRMVCGRCGAPN